MELQSQRLASHVGNYGGGMTDFQERLEKHRKTLYLAVRNNRPDLYRRAVEIGHLAMPEFGGDDPLKRSVVVESAAMSLIAEALGLDTMQPADPPNK